MAKGKLLSEGTYHHLENGQQIGTETWQISQFGHGGIIVASRGQFPEQSLNWNFSFELARDWSPRALELHVERNGAITRSTQRAGKDRWVAEITSGNETTTRELPFSSGHEIDFPSPLFNTVTLLRTRLPVGQSRDLPVVYIPAPSLVPEEDKQLYECLAEDKRRVPAGEYPAIQYRMTHPGRDGARTNEFWTDHQGVVLDYVSQNGSSYEMKLERYLKMERR